MHFLRNCKVLRLRFHASSAYRIHCMMLPESWSGVASDSWETGNLRHRWKPWQICLDCRLCLQPQDQGYRCTIPWTASHQHAFAGFRLWKALDQRIVALLDWWSLDRFTACRLQMNPFKLEYSINDISFCRADVWTRLPSQELLLSWSWSKLW